MSNAPTKSIPRIALESGIAVFIGFLLAFIVHFTFGEEFETRQQARIYAPIAGDSYGSGRRDDIRVVLIDDAALAAAGQQWPAQYGYSARLLAAIAQYRPKAVMVDVYYRALRDDPSLPALARSVCALHDDGIPLFLASARDGAGAYRLRPELDALAGRCFDKVAIQYTPDDIDRMAWNYQLTAPGAQHGDRLKSAALALYETGGHRLEVDHHPLALTWGSRAAAHGLDWERETGAGKRPYCRAAHGWRELLPPGLREHIFHDAGQPLCVFHETLSAAAFVHTTPAAEATLRRELEGKIVLVGLANSDSSDFVSSPLHGRIPGVYLHAMALDNLLVAGDAYARDMHLGWGWEQLRMLGFLLASMLLVTVVPKIVAPFVVQARFGEGMKMPAVYLAQRCHADFRWGRCHVGRLLFFLALCLLRLCAVLVLGCLMVWVGQRWFGLGFMSVIGVIFLTMIGEWFEFNHKVIEHLLPEHEEVNDDNTHGRKHDDASKQLETT